VKRYLDGREVKDCWFAYFGQGVLDTSYYGIPCRPLPTADSLWIGERIICPPEIDGPVLISAGVLSGFEFGPGELNPYAQFRTLQSVAAIDHGVFVYEGHFAIPLAAAHGYIQRAENMMAANNFDQALEAAQEAVRLAPASADAQITLGNVLTALSRKDEARSAFERALALVKSVQPEFQGWKAFFLNRRLAAR
jgi:tetratricopeptide (TPR) repeat protein